MRLNKGKVMTRQKRGREGGGAGVLVLIPKLGITQQKVTFEAIRPPIGRPLADEEKTMSIGCQWEFENGSRPQNLIKIKKKKITSYPFFSVKKEKNE